MSFVVSQCFFHFPVKMTKLWILMTIAAVPFMAAYRLGDKDKYQITQTTENLTDDVSLMKTPKN